MLAWEQADGVHVAGPVPDLRQPVPDCSVIAQRRLTAGTDPYWGRADVPGATSGKPPLGKSVARKPARAFRSLRVARRQRGKAVRLRLRISRGPARVTVRLTRGHTAAGRVVRRRARRGTLRLRVPLNANAQRALARSGRLALRLRVTVRAPGPGDHDRPPPGGRQACLTRGSDDRLGNGLSAAGRSGPSIAHLPPSIDGPASGASRHADVPPQRTGFRSRGPRGRTGGSTDLLEGDPMSKSRMVLAAAVAALAVMLIGGAGPAAAQTSTTPLTKTVKMTGTAKNGKKFKGTYTIKRFTHRGSKLYAVGTLKGRLKGRRVTKNNVRIPASLARPASAAQIPPTPNACQILNLTLQPIDLNLLGLRRAHEPHRPAPRGRRRAPATWSATCSAASPASSTRRPRRPRRRRCSRRS